jgi:predicted RNase H-like nuclease (RuvC/YqgF family)
MQHWRRSALMVDQLLLDVGRERTQRHDAERQVTTMQATISRLRRELTASNERYRELRSDFGVDTSSSDSNA